MDNNQTQIVDLIKSTNNILVTVSNNPSVDQLAATIGFALLLNKIGKHATAVFSGNVPSTIEFLQPDKTLEKNTDSLRDFIIALDKAKADVIRYKVEGDHVKIFITPYRTSISEQDLQYSQGDFNIDAVIAIGVKEQKDLDRAITAHGRILHGASVVQVDNQPGGSLGNIIWVDQKASSLCEMMASLSDQLSPNSLDGQMATAFLTGIVAETERFSNEKTSSQVMSLSAKLMSEGANQQLIANELKPPAPEVSEKPVYEAHDQPEKPADQAPEEHQEEAPKPNDGSLQIDHQLPAVEPYHEEDENNDPLRQIHINDQGEFQPIDEYDPDKPGLSNNNSLVLEPPTLGGTLTANSRPEDEVHDRSIDPLSAPDHGPMLSHTQPAPAESAPVPLPESPIVAEPEVPAPVEESAPATAEPSYEPLPSEPKPTTLDELLPPELKMPSDQPAETAEPAQPSEPAPADEPSVIPGQTLADLEVAVDSPHVDSSKPLEDLDQARDAVLDAIAADPNPPREADQAMGSSLGVQLDHEDIPTDVTLPPAEGLPPVYGLDPQAPPPGPPPMMPPLPGLPSSDPYSAGMPPINDPQNPPSPPAPTNQ